MLKKQIQPRAQASVARALKSGLLIVRIAACLVGLAGMAALAACEQQDPSSRSAQIEVTDYAGKQVELSKPAERVIALSPHIVENLYSAGAGDKIVGVVTYSNFPEQAQQIEVVGSYNNINHERILELNPDLIIAWQSNSNQDSINRLKELGFAVYIDQPKALADTAKSIRDFGILSGTSLIANAAANQYLSKLKQLKNRFASAQTVSTFYQVWNRPLQTISAPHVINDVIELCGGRNIYADLFAVAPLINIESVLEINPQAIIASGVGQKRPDWLDEWKSWTSLTAVKNNHLFFVQPDYIQRYTVRILQGIETMCQQLDRVRNKIQTGN